EQLRATSPHRVPVDRHADLAEAAREGSPCRAVEERAVGGDVQGERRSLVKPSYQVRKAREREGLPASKRHLEGPGVREVPQDLERRLRGPTAVEALVTAAEAAREVAGIGDPEHHHARRRLANVTRTRSPDAHVRARPRMKVLDSTVECIGTKA